MSNYEIVETFKDIKDTDEGIFLRTQWMGLPDECDWTQHTLEQMHTDVPEMVDDFLKETSKRSLARKARAALRSFSDTA